MNKRKYIKYIKAEVIQLLSKISPATGHSREEDIPAFEWYIEQFPDDTDYTKLYKNLNMLKFVYEDDVPTYGYRCRIEHAKTAAEKDHVLGEAFEHYDNMMEQEAELREEREKASIDMFCF